MACLNESPFRDFSSNATTLQDSATTPFQLTYPMITTPLILPREWPDSYYHPSADPLCDTYYDFQSNHLENARLKSLVTPPLGLGIRNIEIPKDSQARDSGTCGIDGVHGHQTNERRYNHRNFRTDSIYDASEQIKGEPDGFSSRGDSTTGLSSLWSFSSILQAAELAANDASMDMQTSFSSKINIRELTSQYTVNPCAGMEWSFEKLSAATGMSVTDFAAQISASAEATLKRMTYNDVDAEASSLRPGDFQWFEDFDYPKSTSTWQGKTEELSLPLTDMNMRSEDASWNAAGVNPADILLASQSPLPLAVGAGHVFLIHPDEIPLPPSDHTVDPLVDNHTSTESMAMTLEQSSTIAPDLGSLNEGSSTLSQLKSGPPDVSPGSGDDASIFQSPSSSEYSPTLQSLGMKRPLSSRVIKRITRNTRAEGSDLTCADSQSDPDPKNLPPLNLGTPVFDAHRGIDIEVLKAKAERYRLRNQGRDYDKRWLISFAGKLSARGELVDEFRCYVAGCKQSNKRRDHILIHVGAHLDQRPFKCMHCLSRFLRKNECKRHELSHTGIRPFSCQLCPSPATTFVRQDLLKRHMKRTHRMDIKADKENGDTRRPKKKARY